MSVRMEIYFVDWDDFQEKVLRDDPDEVLERLESEDLDDPSDRAPLAFLEAFDRFKRDWKSDAKLHFKEVFDTLFWQYRDSSNRIMELREGEDFDLFGIDTALGPGTVEELLEQAARFDLEDCRPYFERTFDPAGRFKSFDEWKSYGEGWLKLLGRAAEEGKGLVVAMFG
jgi:hypothetical protein